MKAPALRRKGPALAILALALVFGNGCFDDDASTGPEPADPPALPPAEALDFDFGFFQDPTPRMSRSADSYENFLNAYLRVAVVGALTRIVLTPPVAVFGLALHTIPSPQPDGSWLWVYTWVNGAEEAQIRLRGKELSDGRVEWSLRLSNTTLGWDQELWFEGETWDQGDGGEWTFYAFDREGDPDVAELRWDDDADGDYLRFTDLDQNPGNFIEYREAGDARSLQFLSVTVPDESWFARWDESDGTGSFQSPSYRDGEQSCWDENQLDTECPQTPTL